MAFEHDAHVAHGHHLVKVKQAHLRWLPHVVDGVALPVHAHVDWHVVRGQSTTFPAAQRTMAVGQGMLGGWQGPPGTPSRRALPSGRHALSPSQNLSRSSTSANALRAIVCLPSPPPRVSFHRKLPARQPPVERLERVGIRALGALLEPEVLHPRRG